MTCLWSHSLLAEAKESKLSDQHELDYESFIPPKVFRQSNLVRKIQLEKVYARETISVTVENIDKAEQYDYFLPFDTEVISRIGGFGAGDKDQLEKGLFQHEKIGNDSSRSDWSHPVKIGSVSFAKFSTVPFSMSAYNFQSHSSQRNSKR